MNQRNSPKFAIWLIEKLGFLRHNPALHGDLLEEFRSGARSNGWFWRQTAVVIANGIRRNAARLLAVFTTLFNVRPPGLLGEFATLFGIQALLDCLLWRVLAQVRMGKMDAPALVTSISGDNLPLRTVLRKKPLGGLDASTALVLYVFAAPWNFTEFPNGMSLLARVSLDFVQVAVPFGIAFLFPAV